MGGSPAPPTPPTPGDSAIAQAGSTAAGKMMDIANAPIAGYANAYTSGMINPYTSALATALQNRSMLSTAQANKQIQSQVDPQVFNNRQMSLDASSANLGRLYGVQPGGRTYTADPNAFNTPSVSMLPNLGDIGQGAADIATHIAGVTMDKDGNNVQLTRPKNTKNMTSFNFPN